MCTILLFLIVGYRDFVENIKLGFMYSKILENLVKKKILKLNFLLKKSKDVLVININ